MKKRRCRCHNRKNRIAPDLMPLLLAQIYDALEKSPAELRAISHQLVMSEFLDFIPSQLIIC